MGARTAVVKAPRRIQRRRSAGWRLPEGAIDVTTGKWANPFAKGEPITRDGDLWPYVAGLFPHVNEPVFAGVMFESIKLLRPEEVVAAHGWWFIQQPALMLTVEEELGGRDLACFCKPGVPCHGDFLLATANGWDEAP